MILACVGIDMVGEFDAYVQDEQEKAMQVKYAQYLKNNDPADVVDFTTFCENEEDKAKFNDSMVD